MPCVFKYHVMIHATIAVIVVLMPMTAIRLHTLPPQFFCCIDRVICLRIHVACPYAVCIIRVTHVAQLLRVTSVCVPFPPAFCEYVAPTSSLLVQTAGLSVWLGDEYIYRSSA